MVEPRSPGLAVWRKGHVYSPGPWSWHLVLGWGPFPQPQLFDLSLFKHQPLASWAGLGTARVVVLGS